LKNYATSQSPKYSFATPKPWKKVVVVVVVVVADATAAIITHYYVTNP